MTQYGAAPEQLSFYDFTLPEVMYYLYLPVRMPCTFTRLPMNVEGCRSMIMEATKHAMHAGKAFEYIYLSARKGWASPDNPLNRPGWHCDGFGSDDMNYVWWKGPGTRFAIQDFGDISEDHFVSARQFEERIDVNRVLTPQTGHLYAINPFVVHATPLIEPPGCMRQFIKISLSNERYNMADNSHNYLFQYDWQMHDRAIIRNDPFKAQHDYVQEDK